MKQNLLREEFEAAMQQHQGDPNHARRHAATEIRRTRVCRRGKRANEMWSAASSATKLPR